VSKKYEIGEEDKMELYRAFIKKMIDKDYTPEFIGEELAAIAHALCTAEE